MPKNEIDIFMPVESFYVEVVHKAWKYSIVLLWFYSFPLEKLQR